MFHVTFTSFFATSSITWINATLLRLHSRCDVLVFAWFPSSIQFLILFVVPMQIDSIYVQGGALRRICLIIYFISRCRHKCFRRKWFILQRVILKKILQPVLIYGCLIIHSVCYCIFAFLFYFNRTLCTYYLWCM